MGFQAWLNTSRQISRAPFSVVSMLVFVMKGSFESAPSNVGFIHGFIRRFFSLTLMNTSRNVTPLGFLSGKLCRNLLDICEFPGISWGRIVSFDFDAGASSRGPAWLGGALLQRSDSELGGTAPVAYAAFFRRISIVVVA